MRKTYIYAAMAAMVIGGTTACGGQNPGAQTSVSTTVPETETEVDLTEVHQAVKEACGENYIPSMAYDEEMLANTFGLEADLYDSYIAEGPMITVQVEQFVAVKAKEGKGDQVAEKLNAYRDNLLNNSMQYPMNLPKIEASQVVQEGDYVFFVMLGSPTMEAEEQGEEAALESAKEANQAVVDTILSFF